MNIKEKNISPGFELMEEDEYNLLLKQRDSYIDIGDKASILDIKSKSQSGFATGLILGMSAGITFVIIVVVLYMLGVINL